MPKIFLFLLIPAMMFAACNSASKPGEANTQEAQATPTQTIIKNTGYRRYTGTIAGQPVVVNLANGNNGELVGAYYYQKNGIILDLYSEADSTKGGKYFIYEQCRTERTDDNDYHNNNHWLLTINGDKATGKWIGQDGKRQFDIVLKEDYQGAYQFAVKKFGDSVFVNKGNSKIGVTSTYRLTLPVGQSKADSEFIYTALLKQMGGSNGTAKDLDEYLADANKSFFKQYFDDIDTTEEIDSNQLFMHCYERNEQVDVVYNDRQLLIFRYDMYLYLGGAHGIYGSSYVCLDMQQRKLWELPQIMNVDSAKLRPLIETEARKIFKIPAGKSLGEVLLVDTIPVTDNIYFTHTGIVFTYVPYEIASFADGQVSFFIPYTQLGSLLKPEFRQRMKI